MNQTNVHNIILSWPIDFFVVDKYDIWSIIYWKICAWCLYALFHICVETNFVDFEEFCGFVTFAWNK